jgi:hypothetical protein
MGAFEDFRGFLVKHLRRQNEKHLSEIKTLEVAEGDARKHLPVLVVDLEMINTKYDVFQASVCRIAKAVAIVLACVCVAVAYFGEFGAWDLILIIPYPAYIVTSLFVFAWFRFQSCRRKSNHEDFLNHYEGKNAATARATISKDLASLK